jgi:hypothetical protein
VTPGPAACMPGHAFHLCLLSCVYVRLRACASPASSPTHTQARCQCLALSTLHLMLTYVQSGQWRPPTQIRRIQGANFFKISSQLPNHIMSLPPAVPIQTIHSGKATRGRWTYGVLAVGEWLIMATEKHPRPDLLHFILCSTAS